MDDGGRGAWRGRMTIRAARGPRPEGRWTGCRSWAWILLGLGLLVPLSLLAWPAMAGELGVPRRSTLPLPVTELGGSRQVWAVAQDARGLLYLGTSSGVLEFDGVAWRRLEVDNQTTVRSLAVDEAGRVWVGAQGEIGVVEAGAYRSLLPRLSATEHDFRDVWKTHVLADGVFFQSFDRLMLWDGSRFRVWRPEGAFHFSFAVGGQLYLLDRDHGLVRWVGLPPDPDPSSEPLLATPAAGFEPVAGGEIFAGRRVYALLEAKAGGLLVATREAGIFRLADGRATPLGGVSGGLDELVRQAQVYHGTRLEDGTVALATLRSGLFLLDDTGRLLRHIDRGAGLSSDGVKFLLPGQAGGLWLGLDKGVDRLDLPSPWSVFGEAEGLDGVPLALVRHRGSLWAATNRGLRELVPSAGGPVGLRRSRWVPVVGIEGQIWSLLDLGDSLLAATVDGVFELSGPSIRRVAGVRAAWLERSPSDPERVHVALFDGAMTLRKTPKGWVDEGRLEGVEGDVRTLAEDGEGFLWLWAKGRGLLRLRADAGRGAEVRRFADEDDSPRITWLTQTADGMHFVGPKGLYRFDPDADRLSPVAVDEWPSFEGLGAPWMVGQGEGRLWVGAGPRLVRFEWEGRRWRLIEPAIPGREIDYLSALLVEDDGVVWIGRPEGLLRYDSRLPLPSMPPPVTLLRRVEPLALPEVPATLCEPAAGQLPRVAAAAGSLRFGFSAPALATQPAVFQSRLVGFESGWSAWRSEDHRDFTRLAAGRYRFEVRARDPVGRIGPVASCAFEVVPPWNRRPWVLVLFGLFAVLLASLTIGRWLRRARLQSQQDAEHGRRQEELAVARRLQQQLLPGALPTLSHLEIAAHQETATEVGGDYYDFFPQDDGRLYLALGDATGHGLGAGLLVTATKAALLSLRQGDMGQAAGQINTVLTRMGFDRRLNMALGLISLDPPDSGGRILLTASGGGLAPIYHLSAQGVEEIILGGLPLGAMANPELPTVQRMLEPGDLLVLMSDGLPEVTNAQGEVLGYERLLAWLRRVGGCDSTEGLLAGLLTLAETWAGEGAERLDDLTLVVVRLR